MVQLHIVNAPHSLPSDRIHLDTHFLDASAHTKAPALSRAQSHVELPRPAILASELARHTQCAFLDPALLDDPNGLRTAMLGQ
jgi:hypothetical protein